MIIQRQITWKWYSIQLYLQGQTNRKSYMIYRSTPFSITLNDPYPQFHGHAILGRWIIQKRYDIQTRRSDWNTNWDSYTTYATVSLRMTLSDLAKYLMTRSVARSLCDSWASCWWSGWLLPCWRRLLPAEAYVYTTATTAKNVHITVLPSHSCGGTLQSLYAITVVKLSVDVYWRSE